MECRHLDGDKRNNSLDNLVWGTHSENQKDNYKNGVVPRGEGSHLSKLTEMKVMDILVKYHLDNVSAIELADRYKLSRGYVHHLVAGRSWNHVWSEFKTLFERVVPLAI
jgi:hypothetical protein